MTLALPELVLRAHFDIRERFGLGQLDTIARPEHEQLEEERRSRTPGGLCTYTNNISTPPDLGTRDLTTHLLRHVVEAHVLVLLRLIRVRLQLPPDHR